MSILNLLLDNLKFSFSDLAKQIRLPSSSSHKEITNIKYIETLFLTYFPYCLAENFEYTPESKKLHYQIGSNTINFLLCKFCSSSLLQLSESRLLEVLKYSMDSLVVGDDRKLELNELITVLNLSETIFTNFTNSGIIKPFLVALTTYFEHASKFSHNKWLVFQFLCREFYENDNLKE